MFEELFGKREEISLLIDIGNGSIAGALASFSENGKPKILFNTRKAFDITDTQSNAKLVENTYTLLNDILKEIMKDKVIKSSKISDALISFSSPWFVLETKNIHISNDKPFIITKIFIEDVKNKQEALFKKKFEGSTEKSFQSHSVKVLDKAIISSKLNGYTLKNNIGKKTKIFDASICLSAVSKIVANKVLSIISKQTGIDQDGIVMNSFPLISYTVVRDFFITDNNYLIMDITGETTDITMVIDGVLVKNISFPLGRNFIIRQIAKRLNVSAEISESMFHLYTLDKVNDEDKNIIYEVLGSVENEWSISFGDALSDLSPNMVLPSKVFLTADDDVAPFYSDCMRLPKTDTTVIFRKNVNIIHINKQIISHIYENDLRVKTDEFIGLLAIFYNQSKNNE